MPACASASATATFTAVLVSVAPETPSICAPPAALTWSARVCAAAPPMAAVSPEASTVTSVIASPAMVSVTVTSLSKPSADAVYTPSAARPQEARLTLIASASSRAIVLFIGKPSLCVVAE